MAEGDFLNHPGPAPPVRLAPSSHRLMEPGDTQQSAQSATTDNHTSSALHPTARGPTVNPIGACSVAGARFVIGVQEPTGDPDRVRKQPGIRSGPCRGNGVPG